MFCKSTSAFIVLVVLFAAAIVFAQDIGVVQIGPAIPGQGGSVSTGTATGQGAAASGSSALMGGQVAPTGQVQIPGAQSALPGGVQALSGQTATSGTLAGGDGITPGLGSGVVQGQAGRSLAGIPGWAAGGEELSDIEKFMSGKAPSELIFDIKQFGYDYFAVTPATGAQLVQTVPTQGGAQSPLVGGGIPGATGQSASGLLQSPGGFSRPGQTMQGQGGAQSPWGGAGIPSASGQAASGLLQAPGGFSQSGQTMQGQGGAQSPWGGGGIPSASGQGASRLLQAPRGFLPPQNLPVGPDYIVGPGDEIRVSVWGSIDGTWSDTVDRDGNVTFPKVGTLSVAGLSFEELKKAIHNAYSKSFTDFEMNVTMGQLRTMQVYMVGNAKQPGAYSISALSTFIGALFETGGPAKVGSMRDLQVLRSGETLIHFDLYEFLLKGRKNEDLRLMPEDVIYVPPIGPIAGIAGNVKVPAIYELKGPTRVTDLIKMAGGVTASAYLQRVQVERVFENKTKMVVDLDLKHLKGRNDITLAGGDLVKVFPIASIVINKVVLQGNVVRPGEYAWKEGMRVLDLIKSTQDLLPDTLMDVARIDRLVAPDYHKEYRVFNLGKLLLENDREQNLALHPYDNVVVFNRWAVQAKEVVKSEGALYNPGTIEFRPNMKLSDLIKLSGGLRKYAYEEKAELTRVTPTPTGPKTEKMTVYPKSALQGDPIDDIPLQQDDYLFVRTVPEWDLYKLIAVQGEVKYPGNYSFAKGEKLSSVLARAGGFTDRAYPRGGVFVRASVKLAQQAQMKDMIDRLQRELLASGSGEAGASMTGDEAKILAEEQKQKEKFVASLRRVEAKGRLVVALASPEELKGSTNDLELEDGDMLYIPQLMQTVQVVGAVYNQTSFTYRPGKDHSFYVSMAGGYTRTADRKQLYIVKADGRATKPKGFLAWSSDSSQWNAGGAPLEPGDTIVVPDKLDKFAWLRNIKDITGILANVASSAGIAFVGMK